MLGIAAGASFESQPVGKLDTSPSFGHHPKSALWPFVAMYLSEEWYMVFVKNKEFLSVVSRTNHRLICFL